MYKRTSCATMSATTVCNAGTSKVESHPAA